MTTTLFHFAESLRDLGTATTAECVEQCWTRHRLEEIGWEGLDAVGSSTDPSIVPVLEEVEALLAQARGRFAALPDGPALGRVRTFRAAALERLHDASVAALVAHRFGAAGLETVLADVTAPLGRRYRAFVLLTRLHAATTWPMVERYLVPEAHHAFLGVAVEAGRFYPQHRPAARLVGLFDAIRHDRYLRAFLSPRLFATLFVLADPVALPLYRELTVAGHTDPDPRHCEVTHALVMLRRLTGVVPPSSKFAEDGIAVHAWLDAAERRYDAERDRLRPVCLL
jgi:hypothetical protein